MNVSIQCPHCRKVIPISAKLAGRKGKCPGCKKASRIPTDLAEFDPLLDEPYSTSCPVCFEFINRGSAKCDHCNEIFYTVIKGLKPSHAEKPTPLPSKTGNTDCQLDDVDVLIATLSGTVAAVMSVIWMFQRKRKGKKMLALSVSLNIIAVAIALGFGTVYTILSSH